MYNTIIVGSGFSGINLAVDLMEKGDTSFLILDRGSGFGGTWRDNTYPGAECDIQSHLYSFSFFPNPDWSKTYAPQPEILEYLESVAETWNLSAHARFNEELLDAEFDNSREVWVVKTEAAIYECRYLALCTGHLSDPRLPDVSGVEEYEGTVFHSARWDHDTDLTGQRIAVIGTGASAIQIVPELADQDYDLTVFQRSAPYVIPRLDNKYSPTEKRKFRRAPESARAFREFLFWSNESRFLQRMMVEPDLSRMDGIAKRHRETQLGENPELLPLVSPDYTIGCKRILLSNSWYPALTRSNVELVGSGVSSFHSAGLVDSEGVSRDFDVVILCSGFEAQRLPIAERIGNGFGRRLADHWSRGNKAFGGMLVAQFPNMFMINGPHVGLGAGSIISMIEVQSSYIASLICSDDPKASSRIEVRPEAEDAFFNHLQRRAEGTVWTSGGCESWYVDSETGELSAIWPDMMNRYGARFASPQSEDFDISHV